MPWEHIPRRSQGGTQAGSPGKKKGKKKEAIVKQV